MEATTEITLKTKCLLPGEWLATASDGREYRLSLHVMGDGYRNWIVSGPADENVEWDDIRSKANCLKMLRDYLNGREEVGTTVTLY